MLHSHILQGNCMLLIQHMLWYNWSNRPIIALRTELGGEDSFYEVNKAKHGYHWLTWWKLSLQSTCITIIDVVHSANLISKLKQYAEENGIIVRYETIKAEIRKRYDEQKQKYHFFAPFRTDVPLAEHLKELKENFEKRKQTDTKSRWLLGFCIRAFIHKIKMTW